MAMVIETVADVGVADACEQGDTVCWRRWAPANRSVDRRARPPWVHLAQVDPQRFQALLGRRSGTPYVDTAMGGALACGMLIGWSYVISSPSR
jgi:hypothetical protein